MSTPLSRRATIATFVGLGVAVTAVTLSFVWPGFFLTSHSCASPGTPTEYTNGRTYCYRTVPMPEATFYNPNATHENWTIYSQWGCTFALFHPFVLGEGVLDVNITEPDLATFSQGLVYAYGAPHPSVVSWFAPDNSSGVIVSDNLVSTNVSLLVRA